MNAQGNKIVNLQAVQNTASEIDQLPTAIASSGIDQAQAAKAPASWWSRFCDRLAAMLLQQQEPIATEKFDANGSYWQIYDPASNQTFYVRSQQDALIWIERRQLRQPKASCEQRRL